MPEPGTTIPISTPGIYTLTVTNSDNNCEGTATVQVIQNDLTLESAFAQADYVECEATATLIGNLPAGTTGTWTSISEADIEDTTAATTNVSGFGPGVNQFVWTLSLGDCLNYSSDTVSFAVNQVMPNAVSDNATLQPGTGGQVTINVLENDEFTAGNISFTLLPNTIFGVVTSNDEGDVVYTKEKCVVGKVEIPYQICDMTCPDLCDEATLTIDVLSDPEEACGETPNGITPNGDGVNDELVFDELLNTSEIYPDNEIVIFNRWGDVVYQAKPYLNDWQGTNKNGDELPHATYYYILRLNIADGQILRGDVTIIK
ncbi:MAG: gliding motility-associated C-terminal domain-containing protein [Saprospiraceae bacterium]|nr:gliding motility-associated C-terminal domain-containing protein [Saprospiraceae bacterium]